MFVVRNCSTILLGASNKAARDPCPRGLKEGAEKAVLPKKGVPQGLRRG
jgi:hypothetical protein